MIRTSMFVVAAVGALGLGLMATGPSAAAIQADATASITITAAAPAAVATPTLTIRSRDPRAHLSPGDIFAGAKYDLGAPPTGSAIGPDIVDDHGRQIYFVNLTNGLRATDVRTQTYFGQPVLTYWQGGTGANPGVGIGDDYIYDQHYQLLRTVHAHGTEGGLPLRADQHEFLLTPGGTAILVAYGETRIDARPFHGPSNQLTYDCVIQEIDLKTAKVVFEWHSLNHVSPARSYQPLPVAANGVPAQDIPWDYFHINAVRIDKDYNLLVSARHTWSIYKVNRHTGGLIWILRSGNHTTGDHSDFSLGSGAAFSWQHDPEPLGNNEYRIFANNWNQLSPQKQPAHVVTLKLDLAHHTATKVGQVDYTGPTMYAGSQGDSQQLPAYHVLIGWGAGGDITEVNGNGQQVFDAQFAGAGFNTYRAYKAVWVGRPTTNPTLSIKTVGGRKQADVVWNGANTVARWRILSGSSPTNLASIGSTAWNGLDTAFRLPTWGTYVKAVALDAQGRVLAGTAAVHT